MAWKATTGRVLAVWKGAGGAPAIIENRFGNGRAIYISAGEAPASEGTLLEEMIQHLISALRSLEAGRKTAAPAGAP